MQENVKSRPILFSAPMVRALLEKRKTQTRRVIKPQPEWSGRNWTFKSSTFAEGSQDFIVPLCPYGIPGDRLWVKETWWQVPEPSLLQLNDGADTWPRPTGPKEERVAYGGDYREWGWKLKPSIYMSRWASRLTLEVTEIRVQRLQEISEEDALAEGITAMEGQFAGCYVVPGPGPSAMSGTTAKECYARLWDSINDAGSWGKNPWVWAVNFRMLKPEVTR